MLNQNPIYTITSFNLSKGLVERIRCVGYYHEFDIAEKCVKNNDGDINENRYYSHVVIEQVEPGLYPTNSLSHRWFYAWDGKGYIRCDDFVDPCEKVVSYAPIG